ncbi:MAG: DUF418 domain-containing protein [Chloroflexota bacterium]
MHATTSLEPVRVDQRIERIDILRGFALTGVLLVNMMNYGGHSDRWTGSVDRAFHVVEYFFFEQRFWHLFSLLFGLGFAVQLLRADAKGVNIVSVYLRRLMILFGFGALNNILWGVDILTDYAILGVFLLPLRRLSPKAVLALALLLQVAPTIHGVSQIQWHRYRVRDQEYAARFQQEQKQQIEDGRRQSEEWRRLMAEGSFTGIVAHRVPGYIRKLKTPRLRPWDESWWGFFAMFLCGLYAGKRKILQNYAEHRRFARAVGCVGLMVGVVGMSFLVWAKFFAEPGPPVPTRLLLHHQGPVVVTTMFLGFTGMTFFYAYVVSEWALTRRWRSLQRGFAAVGRTALSNYILQAIVMNVIFMPWGFGFSDQFGPAKTMLLSVPVYVALMLLSVWWVKHFRYGPAEWLWRTLTYGKLQPMQIGEGGQVSSPGL